MSPLDAHEAFAAKRDRASNELRGNNGQVALAKSSISNLFRYGDHRSQRRRLDLGSFIQIIAVDPVGRTLDVEGLATFEQIVDATLPHGLVPLVTPELKHITIGGAICGIGIESTCFRHGFVHDSLIEAHVLVGDGRVVVCSASNADADLFNALPNSYATLGYVLRLKMRLQPIRPYVQLVTTRHQDLTEHLEAMRTATVDPSVEFIEGLVTASDQLYLLTARTLDRVPRCEDITREHVFYQLAQQPGEIHLTAKDYLFRYDPDWFWNIPDTPPYRAFRRYAPLPLRNSAFYTRYTQAAARVRTLLHVNAADGTEPLIQDWEVPWASGRELVAFALATVNLESRPWAVVPIRTPRSPTLYPIRANELYLNLGCYCHVTKVPGREPYHATRVLDRECFALGGIKMLYSSSFMTEAEFDGLYNGSAYRKLKARYDPAGVFPTLFEKCVRELPSPAWTNR